MPFSRGCNLTTLAIGVRIKTMTASAAEMVAFTWVSVAYFLFIATVVAWPLDLDGTIFAATTRLVRAQLGRTKTRNSSVLPADYSGTEDLGIGSGDGWSVWNSSNADLSFGHRQVQILFCVPTTLCLVPFGSWVTVAVVWAARALIIFLLLSGRDAPCSMTQLQDRDAAFGLLLDADELRAALRAHLAGWRYVHPLGRTRATYYRMEDTLTVSYR
jgi:hypothetical protein